MACRQHAERLAIVVQSCAVAASRSTGVVVDGSAEAFQATQVDARKANFFSSGFRFRLPSAVSGVIIDIGLCDQILKPGPRQHVYVPRPPSLPPLARPLTSRTCLVHTGLLLLLNFGAPPSRAAPGAARAARARRPQFPMCACF